MGRKARKPAAKKEKEFSVWDESPVPYPRFKLDLKPEKFAASHDKLMEDILGLILEQVENEMKALPHKERKPTKVNGKHYTPLGGAFLVELLNADDDPEMEPVTLLFGLKDLYLQGFHVAAIWFMLEGAEVPIPPWSQISYGQAGRRRKGKDPLRDGIFTLPWTGNYNDLWPGKYQEFHYRAFRKAYKILRQAPESFLTDNINILRTPIGFFAVGISECVRFKEICEWVVRHSTDPLICVGVILPKEKIKDIGEWATNSKKCYEDDPPERVRVVKRNSAKHSLMQCENVYEKRGRGIAKDSAAAKKQEDGKGKEEANTEEAEIEELGKEDKKEEQSAIDEQEFHQKNDEDSDDEEDILDDEETTSVDFSADGHLAACISADGKVIIRESNTQKLVGALEGDTEIKWVKWNSDGSFMIGGSASHDAWLWSIEHSASIRKLPSKVTCADFSDNGEFLCTGSADGLLIWRPDLECRRVVAVGGEVSCLVITPDSEFVISGSKDGSILVVDLGSGLAICSLVGHMGSSSVTCLAISPSRSKIMASGSSDGKLVVWDVVGQKVLCVCFHEAAVRCLTWIGRTKYVASAYEDGRVCVWDSTTGFLVGRSRKFRKISKLMMSPCGNELVVFASGPARALDVSMFK